MKNRDREPQSGKTSRRVFTDKGLAFKGRVWHVQMHVRMYIHVSLFSDIKIDKNNKTRHLHIFYDIS